MGVCGLGVYGLGACGLGVCGSGAKDAGLSSAVFRGARVALPDICPLEMWAHLCLTIQSVTHPNCPCQNPRKGNETMLRNKPAVRHQALVVAIFASASVARFPGGGQESPCGDAIRLKGHGGHPTPLGLPNQT